jgi:hypothetical protein
MSDFITSIEKFCMEFVKEYRDELKWEWDDRFEAVLATCKTEKKDAIQSSLQPFLKTIWDNSNTDDAPDVVFYVISHFGGLMQGQLLFMSDPNQDTLLFCAWWPWGDGETVSIRIAPFSEKLSDEDKAELNLQFKKWFSV